MSSSSMPRSRLAIWGASGHAAVAAEIAMLTGQFEVVAHLDDVNTYRPGARFRGVRIIDGADALKKLNRLHVPYVFVAIGDCHARLRIAHRVKAAGFEIPVLRHPMSYVASDASIGEGVFIAAFSVVNSLSVVGQCAVINTSATVDHDCHIAAGVLLAPGVHLAGNVTIGERTVVGIGTVVSKRVHVGADTLVGAGSTVLTNLPSGVVAYGSPARIIRRNEALDGEK